MGMLKADFERGITYMPDNIPRTMLDAVARNQ